MNIAFLHGLNSNPISEKSKYIDEISDISYIPSMNYKDKTLFNRVLKEIKNKKIDLIIGSSMGGFFAYSISTLTGIPTVLFNPAFNRNDEELDVFSGSKKSKHICVFGRNDKVIDPKESVEWTRNKGIGTFYYYFENNTHRTPFDIHKKYIEIALNKFHIKENNYRKNMTVNYFQTFEKFILEDKFESSLKNSKKYKMGTMWFDRWMTYKKEKIGWNWKEDKKYIWITRPKAKKPTVRFEKSTGLLQGDWIDQMEMQW